MNSSCGTVEKDKPKDFFERAVKWSVGRRAQNPLQGPTLHGSKKQRDAPSSEEQVSVTRVYGVVVNPRLKRACVPSDGVY